MPAGRPVPRRQGVRIGLPRPYCEGLGHRVMVWRLRSRPSSQPAGVTAVSQRQESKSGFPVSQRVRRTAAALAVLGFLPGATARAQSPPLELRQGDRIVLVGNTLAERLQHYNNFETLLMTRFPDLDLVVRNLGWSGDTITLQPRPLNFGDAAKHLTRRRRPTSSCVLRPERVVRRRGRAAAVRARTSTRISPTQLQAQLQRQGAPRLALISPLAHERLPRLALRMSTWRRGTASWRATPRRCAGWRRAGTSTFVDLFTPTQKR